ncbi:MAG: lytic murein transglycosylase [Burkholderiaceae bacterium]
MTVPLVPIPFARRRLAWGMLSLALLSGCATPPSTPQPSTALAATAAPGEDAAARERFLRWIAQLRPQAHAAGISDATFDAAFADAHWQPRVVELDRAQPEFTRAPWDYLATLVDDKRVAAGREALQRWRADADAAAARDGVPAEVIVAIWGIESDYGANYGDIPTIDALATLGVDGRREAWARGELIAALRILQAGDIARDRMVGSWAGAMGQTQFLPSKFLAYAVDADGDGRRDIWGSMPDVIASTANFLARSGWRSGEPWGIEVTLPSGFDVGRADMALRQPSAQWAAEGVRAVDGAPLPAIADGAILLPAGARGPAFLVGANFRAILKYNNSTNYALAVGLLAQRIAGGPGVLASWPRDLVPLTRAQTQALQSALAQHGFDPGAADGLAGPATRDALRRWQRSVGDAPDGYPTLATLRRLAPAAAATSPSTPTSVTAAATAPSTPASATAAATAPSTPASATAPSTPAMGTAAAAPPSTPASDPVGAPSPARAASIASPPPAAASMPS